jgi:hypothetical protein
VAKRNPTRKSATAGRAKGTRKAAGRGAAKKARTKKAMPKKAKARPAAAKKPGAARKGAAKKRTPAAKKAAKKAARKTITGKVRGVVAAAVQLVAGSLPWSADENDPIALLESDHRRFEALLRQGEETTERAVKGRTALLGTLTAALNVHELIEEKVLYPALKPHAETRDIVLEGFEEHHVADVIVKELHALAKDNEQWGAKFKVLQESLEHHIKEEEHNMFPTARQVLSREELQDLGARMRAMKAEAERG